MKINGLGSPVQFQQLRAGDVFRTTGGGGGIVMIKMAEPNRSGPSTTACRLDNGAVYTMSGVDSVIHYPKAEIVLGAAK